MHKNDANVNAEIDEVEIVDLPSDRKPPANSQPGKEQDGITWNRVELHAKHWRRQGMMLIIFTGCIALCLVVWPDITAMFPALLTHLVSTPTPISMAPLVNQQENPLSTRIFVSGDTAYISTFTFARYPNEVAGRLDAIHISDGKPFWHMANPVIDTPVEANGIIFIPSTDGIYALRARDHIILWHTHTYMPAAIYRIDNGLIYTRPSFNDGDFIQSISSNATPSPSTITLQALRVQDGSVIWQRTVDTSISYVGESAGIVYLSTSAIIVDVNNTTPTSGQNRLDAIRVSDGAVLWSHESANALEVVETVDSEGDTLICSTLSLADSNTQSSFNIDVLSRKDGKEIWHKNAMLPIAPVKQDILYTTSQTDANFTVAALQPNNGSILWQKTFATEQHIEESGSALYLISSPQDTGSQQNNVIITMLNMRDGSIQWQKKIPGYMASLAGNIIYTIGDGSLDTWQATDGSHLWQREIKTYLTELIEGAATNRVLFLTSNAGWVIHALDINNGSSLWDYEEKLSK